VELSTVSSAPAENDARGLARTGSAAGLGRCRQLLAAARTPRGRGGCRRLDGQEHFVPGIPVGVRSPDWTHVACRPQFGNTLAVSRVDFAWSPDSKRLAFVAADGALDVIAADGTGLVTVAPKPAAMRRGRRAATPSSSGSPERSRTEGSCGRRTARRSSGGGTRGLVGIELATGKRRTLTVAPRE
jgi:hypothetical protein